MVPSIDTHLKKEVTNMLDIILHECYIIDEVLRDFDPEVVKTFKTAYCGDSKAKNEVTVRYSFPDIKTPYLASYVIQLGDGLESKNSLGGVEGTFINKEKGYRSEDLDVKVDNNRLYVEASEEIGEYISSSDVAFAESDNLKIEGNRLYFALMGNEILLDRAINIKYSSKYPATDGEDPHGTYRGFTASESVSITSLSNNTDTVRCLDAILKVILIMLRQSDQEQNYYSLQKTRFSALAPVINDGETRVMGRTVTLTYTSSYFVEYNVANSIKEIIFRRTMKDGKE